MESNIRTQELMILKRKLKENSQEEEADTPVIPPSIYSLLPHLKDNKHGLKPFKWISKGRSGVTLAFGIPTILRQNTSYLPATIESLVGGLTASEKNDTLIIVFIGDQKIEDVENVTRVIEDEFPQYIESGLLEIICASSAYYPNLDDLPSTFGDPPQRVKWRAKQNLDYAYLMMYAQGRALFYVQMEDDIIAKPGYARVIKTFTMQQETTPWFMLEFSTLGFIGKLFRSYDLAILIKFFMIFYKDKPNDWLLDHVFHVKACHPEKTVQDCQADKNKLKKRYKPSLFQHVGKQSSLLGKKQLLVDRDFKKQLPYASLNPPATVVTTFEAYKTHTANNGYLGRSIFWAMPPQKGSYLRMIFVNPEKVKSFRFKTGNTEHPGDVLVNASVQVLVEKRYHQLMESNEMRGSEPKFDLIPIFDDGAYVTVGKFNKEGVAEGKLPIPIQYIHEVLIRVLYDVTHNWVIISEFIIETEQKFKFVSFPP